MRRLGLRPWHVRGAWPASPARLGARPDRVRTAPRMGPSTVAPLGRGGAGVSATTPASPSPARSRSARDDRLLLGLGHRLQLQATIGQGGTRFGLAATSRRRRTRGVDTISMRSWRAARPDPGHGDAQVAPVANPSGRCTRCARAASSRAARDRRLAGHQLRPAVPRTTLRCSMTWARCWARLVFSTSRKIARRPGPGTLARRGHARRSALERDRNQQRLESRLRDGARTTGSGGGSTAGRRGRSAGRCRVRSTPTGGATRSFSGRRRDSSWSSRSAQHDGGPPVASVGREPGGASLAPGPWRRLLYLLVSGSSHLIDSPSSSCTPSSVPGGSGARSLPDEPPGRRGGGRVRPGESGVGLVPSLIEDWEVPRRAPGRLRGADRLRRYPSRTLGCRWVLDFGQLLRDIADDAAGTASSSLQRRSGANGCRPRSPESSRARGGPGPVVDIRRSRRRSPSEGSS
jgi:hypothetical protein